MRMFQKLIGVFALLSIAFVSPAVEGFNDNVNRADPNFVKVSLLWIGPGMEFFGCAGHSSLRLQCETFNLDCCFSCESESIRSYPFRFLLGRLKMGMFAVPTEDFLAEYIRAHRSVTQYPLTLPPDVKQRLWEILDEQVSHGHDLPYDYIKYCCVQTMLQPLLAAVRPYQIETAPWPHEVYDLTRREILANYLAWCPWTRLFLHTIAGTEVDREVDKFKTVILSQDFVALLKGLKVAGRPVLAGDSETLASFPTPSSKIPISPVMAGVVILLCSLVNLFLKRGWFDYVLLAGQSLLGMFLFHLVCISTLPATDWNWLIVPFNPLPLLFWKWRARWALAFSVVLIGWELFMALAPHQLTDPAYLVIVPAYIVFYLKFSPRVQAILKRS